MSEASNRIKEMRSAKNQLAKLMENRGNVVVIHYSCESFYDRQSGSSPRITSIAVRNLGGGQTTSFSIHQMAERDKKLSVAEIDSAYDELEKKMLKDFYKYVEEHRNHLWLHWNMRDINYGFPALKHRYQVLGGTPFELPESHLVDLARLLISLYGSGYAGHPRLATLVAKNEISTLNFLNGEQEATAFEKGEYVKLHQSTLRKVDILAQIAQRTGDGSLKTNARWKDMYGGYLPGLCEAIRTHWAFTIFVLVTGIASIVGVVMLFFPPTTSSEPKGSEVQPVVRAPARDPSTASTAPHPNSGGAQGP